MKPKFERFTPDERKGATTHCANCGAVAAGRLYGFIAWAYVCLNRDCKRKVRRSL